MTKYPAIIQARLTSSRLPNKIAIKMGGKTILQHCINSLLYARNISTIYVAVPHDEILRIRELVEPNDRVQFSIGPNGDVYERFRIVARNIKHDYFIRACADSPLICTDIIERISPERYNDIPSIVQPITIPGTGAEVVHRETFCALGYANEDREHPTKFLYTWPQLEKHAKKINIGLSCYSSLTIDTPDDLEKVRPIREAITRPDVRSWDILQYWQDGEI